MIFQNNIFLLMPMQLIRYILPLKLNISIECEINYISYQIFIKRNLCDFFIKYFEIFELINNSFID